MKKINRYSRCYHLNLLERMWKIWTNVRCALNSVLRVWNESGMEFLKCFSYRCVFWVRIALFATYSSYFFFESIFKVYSFMFWATRTKWILDGHLKKKIVYWSSITGMLNPVCKVGENKNNVFLTKHSKFILMNLI